MKRRDAEGQSTDMTSEKTAVEARRHCILMVTGAYLPELSGGGLQCRTMIRTLLDDLDFRVLTTCTDPALAGDDTVEGIRVTRVFVNVERRRTKITAAWHMLRFFARRHRTFDVVHLHGFSQKSVLVVLLARLLRKAVIITIHTAGSDEPEGVRRLGRLAYWCYSRADRFLAVSEAMAVAYRAAGLPEHRLRLAPNGVDVDRFRPAAPGERDDCCREFGLDPALRWVAFAGFFSREKCPDVLFDAWLRLPLLLRTATGLVFAGATASQYHEVDPELARRLRDEATRLGLSAQVQFVGEVAAVERVYRAADVFVMPSTREAFGMVLIEAMASRLPVVCTRISGVTDAIVADADTGVLFPPRDAAALTAALERVLSDRHAAAAMGQRARAAAAARYGLDVSAARWREIYRQVLHS